MHANLAVRSVLTLFAAAATSACVGGKLSPHSSTVQIRTNLDGALATSEYGDSCTTPCKLRLPTGKGGTVQVTREGYEPTFVTVGLKTDNLRVASSGVNAAAQMAQPDPISIAFTALDYLIDAKGHFHKLDTRNIFVAMVPESIGPAPRAVPQGHSDGPVRGGVRLSQQQIDAILGPPIKERPFLESASAPVEPVTSK